ncbi:tyrosine-type recombinase/integrase [Sphingobium sp. B12D2B]|uniref:tyrosine-type recombinase/integrase n=1 Tax=Sphingobium sp. B12D2B TaxID=2940577 RepID=UPI002224B995|nr:tyrosine-type recombinase/integrase [Sphingobium sp. B12D2B]MCW2351815.1 integrase [Sphingobium sp. B12D2B]
MQWSVYDISGHRKYLNRTEIHDLLAASEDTGTEIHAFCRLLAETGCRISEALSIDLMRIDHSGPHIVFECLKKRRKGIFRTVPISDGLAALLVKLALQRPNGKVWRWSRSTAWRHVHDRMKAARISGPQACPKGLRHGFAVAALGAGAPLNLVQRWLGHSDIQTTSLYAVAVGPEEREIVERVWTRFRTSSRRKRSSSHRPKDEGTTNRKESATTRNSAEPDARTSNYFI